MILAPPYRSIIAQAHNGSGKTTCFTLAMLSRVDAGVKSPQALCVCPTRELVVQNQMVLERMGKYTGEQRRCWGLCWEGGRRCCGAGAGRCCCRGCNV